MLKHCVLRLSIVLWCLLVAFSQLGCASRFTVEALHALNPGAHIVQVCTRTPTEHPRAVVWAHNLVLRKSVSDIDPEAFEEFAKTADTFYRYDPHAPSDSARNLPWPYQRMHCETLSSRDTPKLPEGMVEIPISDATREALIASLSAAPDDFVKESPSLAAELQNQPIDKHLLAQAGGRHSLIVSPQRRADALIEVGHMLRDAIRSAFPKVKGPNGEEISVLDTKKGHFMIGLGLGATDSALPMGAVVTDVLIESGVLQKPPQVMRLGKSTAEMVSGLIQIGVGGTGAIAGGGATMTGGGAIVGVPVCVAGVALAANGAVTFLNGARTFVLTVCHWEETPVLAEAQPLAATPLQAPNSPAAPAAAAPSGGTSSGQPTVTPATNPGAAKPTLAKPVKPGNATKPSTSKPVAVKKPCRYGATQSSANTTTWFKCTGQDHHAITAQIHRVLQDHKTLKNVYKYRDSRFVSQAINKEAHIGWETWHRAMEDKVVEWLRRENTATPAAFEGYLRDLYKNDKTLNWRFPNGM